MAGRLKPFIPLEGAQDAASSPDHHAALAASAGTGKTHVLTARVLRLLLRGVRPETILCLTFTKAGAAEMAGRLHARLAYWVRLKQNALALELQALGEEATPPLMDLARSLFARVLEAPGGGLRIQTIHAFAQGLLAAFPAEAGLTPGFRPLEGREELLLARSTLADLLVRAETGGDLPLMRDVQALSLKLGEGGAAALLQLCAKAPEAMAALGAAQGIEARLQALFDLPGGQIEDAVVASCGDDLFDCGGIQRIAELNRAWGSSRGLERANICDAWLAAAPGERAAMLDELHAVWAKDGGASLRSFGKGQAPQEPDYAELAQAAFDYCGRLRALRRTAEWVALAAAGLRAGQAYAGAYEEAKRAQGLVDFDDLIRRTQQLLSTDGMGEWVRFKLDQQTDHLLIDEAQDTNAAQWSIVDALAGEYFAGEGRGRRHRTIFTVGDFKQAIFSFQGTDPQEFEKARRSFSEAARALRDNAGDLFAADEPLPPDFLDLSMDRSFRSAPQLLAVVDQVITELGHEALGLPRRPNPHVSHKKQLAGSVTLWRPYREDQGEEEAGEEGWISDAVRRYAARLARQVRAWLDAPFEVGSGKERRKLQPQDILMLVRRRGDLAGLIVARLHAEGVPVAGIDRLSLSAPLAVQDLLAAARFAMQPLDDLNLASLLVSPLLGWSQDNLFRAAFGRKGALWPHLRAMEAEGHWDLQPLRDMLDLADLATPHEYFERLLSGPLGGRRKLVERLGAEARDPIEELLSSALEFERTGTASLARFLDWFARGEVEIVRDPSAPLDAVRVMTVHGAKGLEAPVVILADACADPARLGPGARFASLEVEDGLAAPVPRPKRDALAEPLKARVEAQEVRDRQEHWRLLYVAMTRAKERLYVGGALSGAAKGVPEDSWHGAVERAMAALGCTWVEDGRWDAAMAFGEAPTSPQAPERDPDSNVIPIRAAPKARPAPPAPVLLPDWLTRVAPAEERPPQPLAPSAIGEDDAAYPPPGPEQRRAAMRGKLLHRLFERLPDVPPEERRARADAWLQRSGEAPDPAFRAALIEDACQVIDDPRFADLFSPAALAEAPIAAVVAGGLVVAGTTDRLLVAPDRILVADFKTGRAVPPATEAAPVSHVRQMAAYRAALRVIFPDRPVEAALLYTAGPVLHALPDALLDAHAPSSA